MLILDEPTAVLTPAETEELFRIIRQLRDGGTSVIFISHKLKEVQAIADTITVLRRGKVVGQRTPPATEDDLASLMVGRDVQLRVSKEPAQPGDVVLDVAELTVARRGAARERAVLPGPGGRDPGHRGRPGQRADRAVRGADGPAAHGGRLGHAERPRPHPRDAAGPAARGRRLRPRRPQEDGLVGSFSVAENLILDTYDRPPFASGINLNLPAIRAQRDRADRGVRRPHRVSRHPGRHAVRRQPAEGHPGQGGRARAQGADREPAHPRPRRRVDRVRAPPDRRAARPRRRRGHRLLRARRDLRAGRPDRGHVRGQDHRLPRPGRARRRARAADGRRRRRRPRARVRPPAGDGRQRGTGQRAAPATPEADASRTSRAEPRSPGSTAPQEES